jgi:hypothetical protein
MHLGKSPRKFLFSDLNLTFHSLLAGLGSGDSEHPASPPSTSVSPALSKATPAEKSDDKKENES